RRLPRQSCVRPGGHRYGGGGRRRNGGFVRHQRGTSAQRDRRRRPCAAVATGRAALAPGASHVQGTVNGYGERTGNADLVSVVANLELKLGRQVLPDGRLQDATRIAHAVAEVTNVPPI